MPQQKGNQTTMKKINQNTDSGITLIVLVVTVIILVILASISIRALTDDDNIIATSQTAATNYVIAQYGDEVAELFEALLMDRWILGDDVILEEIAEEMEEETWIKTAVVSEEGDSIIVTVTEGYVYQVFYDEETGEKQIEYLCHEADGAIPTLTATYNTSTSQIDAVAECTDGIAKLELIYKTEIIATYNANDATYVETSFDVENTGWYTVKATSTKGVVKYAYVRVYAGISAPTIKVTSSGTAVNEWYGADGVALEVTITAGDTSATGMYYKTNNDTEYTYTSDLTKTLTITDIGKTTIYAYNVDKNNNESSISKLEVYFDNIAPVITLTSIDIDGTEGNNNWYTSDVELSFADAITDNASGVAGYYYYVGDDSSGISSLINVSVEIKITSDGETVLVLQAEDLAGNISAESTLTIKKDTVAPVDFEPTIKNADSSSFTIVASTTDVTSGIDYYDFYVGTDKVGSSETGTYDVTSGLSANENYTVYVVAYDKAGNSKTSSTATAKTSGELLAPKITLEGEIGTNNWYTGDVKVTIEDSADSSNTSAYQIKYTVTGADETALTTVDKTSDGLSTSFYITIDGTSTITAYVVSETNSTSGSTQEVVKKDSTAPEIETFELTSAPITTYWTTCSAELEYDVTEATSGIAKKVVYYSESDTFDTYSTVTYTTSSSSGTAEIENLALGTEYYLKIEVTDNAGNTVTSDTIDHDFAKVEVGDYIDYDPDTGSFTALSTYTGYSSDQTFTTTSGLEWIVFEVTDTTITLISTDVANTGFSLYGVEGYNNVVLLLNNACKAMYSNATLNATGRSISLADISCDLTICTNMPGYYGTTLWAEDYLPAICAYDDGMTDWVYQSTQDDYVSGIIDASDATSNNNQAVRSSTTSLDRDVYVCTVGDFFFATRMAYHFAFWGNFGVWTR